MKKYWIISMILVLVLIAEVLLGISWFGGSDFLKFGRSSVEETVPTAAPATQPTTVPTEPTTVPTEPPVVHRNPLNGQILDQAYTDRVFAVTVSNMKENMPHVNLTKADVVMEMFVSMNNIIRCLALYSDVESVEAIASTRSTRPILNDMAQHYSLIVAHAGGSSVAKADAKERNIENFNVGLWVVSETGASYRDKVYKRSYENSLFTVGPGIKAYAESQGYPMSLEKDYGFRFADIGTPESGESAGTIDLMFVYKKAKKETILSYDGKLDKYVWNQYDKVMTDQITGEVEAFTNVLILQTPLTDSHGYHYMELTDGGTGYYANGGVIVPITFTCAGDTEAPRFFTLDGQELMMGVGNTYMAVCSPESSITWTEYVPPVETLPPETVEETAAETTAETTPG